MTIKFEPYGLSEGELLNLYEAMLFPRLIEEKMLILLRQGKISKWFSGIGQEAIAVGITEALHTDDYILPTHRNLGVFTSKGVPFHNLFGQWQGKLSGFTKGRDRSFHFGSLKHHIVGMISHLGAMSGVADGIALGQKLGNNQTISCVFSGDGATSEGDVHEAMNVAAVWDLPVLFIIENNGYGLSTPGSQQFRCSQLADKGKGYGIKSKTIDGNNILEVYKTVRRIRKNMVADSAPYILECMTFRRRGHEEASGVKYVPKELIEKWEKRDPISNFERFLIEKNILTTSVKDTIHLKIKNRIQNDIDAVSKEPEIEVSTENEVKDVFAPYIHKTEDKIEGQREIRFVDAISEGLKQAMQKDNKLIFMGQDIADYGGAFKISDGFLDLFGKERVRNTPICESAIVGCSLGLAVAGYKSIVEMQFSDFVTCAFNQIVNNLAKTHYRWNLAPDVTIRMPTGGTVAAGPFHSQSIEAWFTHVAGLKVVYPSSPEDAKGLLIASIQDPNPVLFFEHKALYRSIKGLVPEKSYTIPIGKAKTVVEGNDACIITYGLGVHWAKDIIKAKNLDVEILDLRTLLPWDKESVSQVVKKTNKVLILHEASLTGGIAGEISAWVGEHLFKYLDAPVIRVAGLDTPVPFEKNLEKNFMAVARLEKALIGLLDY